MEFKHLHESILYFPKLVYQEVRVLPCPGEVSLMSVEGGYTRALYVGAGGSACLK